MNLVVGDWDDLSTDDKTHAGAGLLEQTDHRLVIHAVHARSVHLKTFVTRVQNFMSAGRLSPQ